MVTTKPIKVDGEVKRALDNLKEYKRETYNDVMRRLLKLNSIQEESDNHK